MSLRPPISFGDLSGSPSTPVTRRSAEDLMFSMIRSGVFRKTYGAALYDEDFGESIVSNTEVTTPQTISSASYATLTNSGITITPPVGTSYAVFIAGGCTFEGTPGAGDAWLAITDGTSSFAQQLTSIVSGDWCTVSCAYAVIISAQTVYSLQSKLQGASGNVAVLRSHLAVKASPQSPRFDDAPSSQTVPLYVCKGDSEMVQRCYLIRSTDLDKNLHSFYRVRFGIQRAGGKVDYFATFNGQVKSLYAGTPFDLSSSDFRKRLRVGDVVVADVYREGSPSSIVGTRAEVVVELVGEGT